MLSALGWPKPPMSGDWPIRSSTTGARRAVKNQVAIKPAKSVTVRPPLPGLVRARRSLQPRNHGPEPESAAIARRGGQEIQTPDRFPARPAGCAQPPGARVQCLCANPQMGRRHHPFVDRRGWLHLAVIIELFSRKASGLFNRGRPGGMKVGDAYLTAYGKTEPPATTGVGKRLGMSAFPV